MAEFMDLREALRVKGAQLADFTEVVQLGTRRDQISRTWIAPKISHLSAAEIEDMLDLQNQVLAVMRMCHRTVVGQMDKNRTLGDEVSATMDLLRKRLPELPDQVASSAMRQCFHENR